MCGNSFHKYKEMNYFAVRFLQFTLSFSVTFVSPPSALPLKVIFCPCTHIQFKVQWWKKNPKHHKLTEKNYCTSRCSQVVITLLLNSMTNISVQEESLQNLHQILVLFNKTTSRSANYLKCCCCLNNTWEFLTCKMSLQILMGSLKHGNIKMAG